MHRLVKALRLIIPILLLVFIAVVVASYTRRPRTEKKAEPFSSPLRKGDKPLLVATTFEDTQSIGGRIVSRIRARRTVGFASGFYTLEGVELTIFRADGQTYQLVCPQAQFHPKTKAAEAIGGVTVKSSDGLEFSTASITFDGTKLVNRVPVRFKVDSWEGRAGGMDFSISDEAIRFLEPIEAFHRVPNAPETRFAAKDALFLRKRGEVTFNGGVDMLRAQDSMHSESVAVKLDGKLRTLLGLEGVGAVRLNLAQGSALVPSDQSSGERTIVADRFFAEITNGVINGINLYGDGKPARATFSGPPLRYLDAVKFRVLFVDGAPRELQLAGVVKLTEPAPEKRELFTDKLNVLFDPISRKPSMAFAEGYFRYFDSRNQAASSKASFDLINDQLVLVSVPGAAPRLTADGNQITATRIELSPKEGVLKASGKVTTRLESGKRGATATNTAMFPETDGPVYIQSNNAILRQNEKIAVFSGDVKAWQKTNILFTAELTATGEGETLQAKGGVRATLTDRRAEKSSPTPVQIRADMLFGRKSARKVDLTGNVKIEDELRRVESEAATIFLGPNQKIERIEALRKLTVTEMATGRKGTGDKALYNLAERTILVDGTPAILTEPRGSLRGNQIVFDLNRNKVDVRGQTQTTYNPQ